MNHAPSLHSQLSKYRRLDATLSDLPKQRACASCTSLLAHRSWLVEAPANSSRQESGGAALQATGAEQTIRTHETCLRTRHVLVLLVLLRSRHGHCTAVRRSACLGASSGAACKYRLSKTNAATPHCPPRAAPGSKTTPHYSSGYFYHPLFGSLHLFRVSGPSRCETFPRCHSRSPVR